MSCWYSRCSWEWGEDVRNWIDCIFIAMLCDGGGEGSSVSIPFSALGAHTISFIKNLYNIKVHHHTAQNFQLPGPTKDSSHRKLRVVGSYAFPWGHQEVLLAATWLLTDWQLGRRKVLCFLLWCSFKISFYSGLNQYPFKSSQILTGVNIFPWMSKKERKKKQ